MGAYVVVVTVVVVTTSVRTDGARSSDGPSNPVLADMVGVQQACGSKQPAGTPACGQTPVTNC